jgi:diketogulonate reductase-like aldo/keto reductase
VLRDGDVIAIPKSSHRDRLKENVAAADIELTPSQLAELDTIFPPPTSAVPLEML